MNRKKMLVVKAGICLLFVLTAIISLCLNHSKNENKTLSMKHLLPEFSAEAPVEIRISWKKNVATLILDDAIWRVKERGNHPAENEKVIRLIEQIQKIRPLRRTIPADAETCSLLRVHPEEHDAGKIPGVRIQIYGKNRQLLRDLVLGAGYFTETEMVAPGREPEPSGRWIGIVQKNGSVIPFLNSAMFEEFMPVPGSWMSSPVIENIKQLVRIEYRAGNGSWMIGRFTVKAPFESIIPGTSHVSVKKLNTLAGILSQRYTYEGIREKEAGKLTYIGKMELLDDSGFVRSLMFYRAVRAKGGVLCKVNAYEKKELSKKERVNSFLANRTGWLYVIPEKVFEQIKMNPAGD